jgi:DNA-binding LacI/PurR family transcriptional regulator
MSLGLCQPGVRLPRGNSPSGTTGSQKNRPSPRPCPLAGSQTSLCRLAKRIEDGSSRGRTVVDGDWTSEPGFKAAQELISTHWGKFTAVVVANDQMALGAIRAFEESSIDIRRKISLVGFDDIPEAGFFRPPLSTIKQDFASLGRLSVQCLIAQVDPSRTTSSAQTIQPYLIKRESTAFVTGREKYARSR